MSIELRALVRRAATDFPHDNPRELAKHVAAATSKKDMPSFYEETLADYCAQFLRESRNTALAGVGRPAGPRQANKSPKTQAIRDGWKRFCAERIHVGNGHWRQLGQCGIEDLTFCVAEREQEIERVAAQAENYRILIALLEEYGVATVSELPPDAVFP